MPKAGKNNFQIFLKLILTRKKLPPKPRSCQKLEKSIFEYFLVVTPFHILRCLCHLSSRHGNKSRRNQVWILFTSMLNRKKLPPDTRSCQKVRKSIFEFFSTWIYIYIYIYIHLFSAHMKRATKRSRKVSVPPLLRKASVKCHILRCLCHLSSRHGNKSRRNQFWILF